MAKETDFLDNVLNDLRHAWVQVKQRPKRKIYPVVESLKFHEEIAIEQLFHKIQEAVAQAELIKKYYR